MTKTSYGILMYKQQGESVFVLLAHPGGPFWAAKDFWTIPKGEPDSEEDSIQTARREFKEETGLAAPEGEMTDLGTLTQSSVKVNHIYAVSGDPDLDLFSSNSFEMEWPPKSGNRQSFVEIDRIEWFDLKTAKVKLFEKQREFIDRLEQALKSAT